MSHVLLHVRWVFDMYLYINMKLYLLFPCNMFSISWWFFGSSWFFNVLLVLIVIVLLIMSCQAISSSASCQWKSWDIYCGQAHRLLGFCRSGRRWVHLQDTPNGVVLVCYWNLIKLCCCCWLDWNIHVLNSLSLSFSNSKIWASPVPPLNHKNYILTTQTLEDNCFRTFCHFIF